MFIGNQLLGYLTKKCWQHLVVFVSSALDGCRDHSGFELVGVLNRGSNSRESPVRWKVCAFAVS